MHQLQCNRDSGGLLDRADAANQFVGQYLDSSSTTHSFVYKNSTFTNIDVPGASTGFDEGTFAGAINLSGDIAGYYSLSVSPFFHGFVLSNDCHRSQDP